MTEHMARRGETMRKTIKASFINGNLVPHEPCALNDGEEVLVQVHIANGATAKPTIEQPDIAAKPAENEISKPKGHPVLEILERVKANMPEHLQPQDVPTDAAKNYKHYLYGWPKRKRPMTESLRILVIG